METWGWIPLTLLAVVMQSVRTAGQKHLTKHLDATGATLVRFLFGLPLVAALLFAACAYEGESLPPLHNEFLAFSLLAALGQILATVLLVYLFSLRNFAVGTTYARTESLLTALLGVTLFGELVTAAGWLAIGASAAGVVVLTIAKTGVLTLPISARLWNRAAAVGVASGLGFAVASLSLRKASLSLETTSFLVAATTTLVTMVVIQTAITGAYVAWRSAGQFLTMLRQWRPCVFVGVTSALGSFGWFTAMTLERASYVKALGQIEFIVALGISTFFFRERSTPLELAGMGLVGAGAVVLVLFG